MQNGPVVPPLVPPAILPVIPSLLVTTSTDQASGNQLISIEPQVRLPEEATGHWAVWLGILWCGIAFLPVEYLYSELVSIEVGLLAFGATSLGLIGLSTHVSAYFDEPKFNLGKGLLQFMLNHKLMTSIIGLSLLMFDPMTIVLGIGVGLMADVLIPTMVNAINDQRENFVNWLQQNFNGESVRSLLHHWRHHPLDMLSSIGGSILGLTLFKHYFPKIFPTLFELAIDSFTLIRSASANLTGSISGGIVPHGVILLGSAISLTLLTMGAMVALPAVAVVGGGWSCFKTWDLLHKLGTKVKNKIQQCRQPKPRPNAPAHAAHPLPPPPPARIVVNHVLVPPVVVTDGKNKRELRLSTIAQRKVNERTGARRTRHKQ